MFENFIEFFTIKIVYQTVLTLIIGLIVYSLLKKGFDTVAIKGKDELEKKRRQTTVNLLKNILKYAYAIVTSLVLLQIFGVNTKSLIAGLGIAGVVIGLALQDALKDIISGVSIIMDDYFVVGDLVEIKGFKGTVVSLGLKATKIQSETGTINILTNRTIDNVINYSKKSPKLKLIATFTNNNKQKTIEKYLNKIIDELKLDENIKEVTYLGIDDILDNKVKYAIEINCIRGYENEVKRKFNQKIKELFDAEKIEK